MDLEQHGYAAGSGVLGIIVGALTAMKIIRRSATELIATETAEHVSRISDLERNRKEDNDRSQKLLDDFKRNTEESIRRIETAHERHAMLVVYKDKCSTCEDLRDSKHDSLEGKLDILLDRIKERRPQA